MGRPKKTTLAKFRLKNQPEMTIINATMLRALRKFFHRPVLRFGLKRDARSRFRDPRFVSFLAQSNQKRLNTDFQDAVLQGRRLVKFALVALIAAGGAWIVVESTRALTMF